MSRGRRLTPDQVRRMAIADNKRGAINNPQAAALSRPPRSSVHLCATCGRPYLYNGSPTCGRD